jgi:AraC-like DNA-binding protein
MDPLSDMLSGIRAEGAAVRQASLEPPWTITFTDGAPLTMLTVMGGEGSLVLADGTAFAMGAGDTALVRGPAPFRLTDRAAPTGRPHRSYELSCFDRAAGLGPDPDARRWSGDDGEAWGAGSVGSAGDAGSPGSAEGSTTLLVAAYRASRGRHDRLLGTLPPALVLHEDIDGVLWLDSARDALARRDQPGAQALIDRILDWGLVCTLACWFEQEGAAAPAWYHGALDPVAGPALEAMHQYPEAAWTVGSLAARAGVSRAHFAKRFAEVMGEPPLGYLTEWRLSVAEELLADPDLSVVRVARSVGYSDPAAFSTAFKRRRGVSPREFRLRSA